MEGRGEQEPDTYFLHAAGDLGGGENHLGSQLLEDVGAAAAAGDRAVAVFGHPRPGGGDHESRGRRDVKGVGAVAAGPAGVDQGAGIGAAVDPGGMKAQGAGTAGELVHRLALHPQGHQQGGHRSRRGGAREDFLERRLRLFSAQVAPGDGAVNRIQNGCHGILRNYYLTLSRRP